MKRHFGIYKSDKGWLSWVGGWKTSPRFWWDVPDDYDENFFNLLLKEVLIEFEHNDDVTNIWLVPLDDNRNICWVDAIRLS